MYKLIDDMQIRRTALTIIRIIHFSIEIIRVKIMNQILKALKNAYALFLRAFLHFSVRDFNNIHDRSKCLLLGQTKPDSQTHEREAGDKCDRPDKCGF